MNDAVPAELRPFLGTWVNTLAATAWIRQFSITIARGAPSIEVVGARAPTQWGHAPLEGFRFKPGEHAFRAVFERPDSTCDLVAYSNLGLVVIAAYFDFHDPTLGGHLCREFYTPQADPNEPEAQP